MSNIINDVTNTYITDNFFYIDSNNLSTVENKLYGYCLTKKNNTISFVDDGELLGGTYIKIVKINNKEINIFTDDFSSLLVFYYISDNFFAISNSFYILAENLKRNSISLSINKSYIDQYIQSPLHSHTINNTLINEIKILPFGKDIKIKNNKVEFIDKNIEFHTVNLFSETGMNILNNWINKWTNINKALLKSNLHTQIDLSGGFDSRIIFALNYNTGVNLNNKNINIFSKNSGNKGMLHHLMDDFDVSKKICDTLNLQINENYKSDNVSNYFSPEEQYKLLKNSFMGIHKVGFSCLRVCEKPQLHFGGLNGEVIRGALPNLNKENIKRRLSHNPIKNKDSVIDNFYKDLEELKQNSKTDFEALIKFFLTTQCRSHFGMSMYNSYIANIFSILPYNDKELLKLYVPNDIDKNIIFAIIIYKTCPEIFNIDFMNNQNFSQETKNKAIEISNQYKLIRKDENLELVDIDKLYKHKENKYQRGILGFDVLYNKFVDNKDFFINEFGKLYDKDYATKLYDFANNYYLNKDNFSIYTWVSCLTAIIETLKILKNN